MGKGVSEGTVLCYIVPLREADCLSVFSSPPASPVRLALPVRHLPAMLRNARRAGRLRVRRLPGWLGRRAGLRMAG